MLSSLDGAVYVGQYYCPRGNDPKFDVWPGLVFVCLSLHVYRTSCWVTLSLFHSPNTNASCGKWLPITVVVNRCLQVWRLQGAVI